jgi:hypothetical protein
MEEKRAGIQKGNWWIVTVNRTCLKSNSCFQELIGTIEDFQFTDPNEKIIFFTSLNNDGRKRSNERNLIDPVHKASTRDSLLNFNNQRIIKLKCNYDWANKQNLANDWQY